MPCAVEEGANPEDGKGNCLGGSGPGRGVEVTRARSPSFSAIGRSASTIILVVSTPRP
jgi:hypothetical protein